MTANIVDLHKCLFPKVSIFCHREVLKKKKERARRVLKISYACGEPLYGS